MTRIQLWQGDICDLEVDAIVTAASPSLWMSTGVSSAIKLAGGDEIEFAAVRQAPAAVGDAVATPAGRLAARLVIHAVSLDRNRRTTAAAIEAAIHSTFARAREHGVTSIAFPALGTGVGNFPIEEAARVSVATVRAELARSPQIASVVFAVRGQAPLAALQAALREPVGLPVGSSARHVGRPPEPGVLA